MIFAECVNCQTNTSLSAFVFQDFTGVPAVVDLAAMRDAMKNLNSDPNKINPLVCLLFFA